MVRFLGFVQALLLAVCWTSVAQASSLAITHVTIIDATGGEPVSDGVILIDGDRIVAAGPASQVRIPRGTRVLDKTGKFAIPGLMDANVHLFGNLDSDILIRFRGRYDEIILETAQLALKSGLTTVFDTWGPLPDLQAVRDRINAGKATGSRIFLAGNIIGWGGYFSEDFRYEAKPFYRKDFVEYVDNRWSQGVGRELQWDSAEEIGEKVAAYAARDVDFLKYGSNAHRGVGQLSFSQGAQSAIVAAGHAAGKTVQAHVHTPQGIEMAMNAGVDILTHCDSTCERTIPKSMIAQIAAKGITCSVMPAKIPGTAPDDSDKITQTNIKNLVDAGIPVMLSTDAIVEYPFQTSATPRPLGGPNKMGEGQFLALQGLEDIGIDPMKILQIATINIAKGYKKDKDLGSIEPGKLADIVILDANPLSAAANYRKLNTVIKNGQVVDVARLPTAPLIDRKSTRLNSSHNPASRMPSSA
jgi:imidazolonepropionase-like amidohydrolase